MDGPQFISSNNRSKAIKEKQFGMFYFRKVVGGKAEKIKKVEELLHLRGRDPIFNRPPFETMIERQFVNGEHTLNLRQEWINCVDLLTFMSVLNQSLARSRLIEKIVTQFLAEIIVGPSQFIYAHSNILFLNQDQLRINYLSLMGYELANQNEKIRQSELSELASYLTRQNFQKSKFIGLTHQNKLRAIAILIMNLIMQKKNFYIDDHSEVDNQQIAIKVSKRQEEVKSLFRQSAFAKQISLFQESNGLNYQYFLNEVVENKQKLSWDDVIQFLVQRFERQKPSQIFQGIVEKTARNLYQLQEQFIRAKLQNSLIVGPKTNFNLYIKIKLAKSTKELGFLLRFECLSDLLHHKAEENQHMKQNILKYFFLLLAKTKDTHQSEGSVNFGFSNQQLEFISTFSKTFGVTEGIKQESKYSVRNYENRMLNQYLQL